MLSRFARLALLTLLFATACSSQPVPPQPSNITPNQTPDARQTVLPIESHTAPPPISASQIMAYSPDQRLLAWFPVAGGTPESLASAPSTRSVVATCAERDDTLILRMGGDTMANQDVYPLDGKHKPLSLGELPGLSCTHTFGTQFMSATSDIALIRYPDDVSRRQLATGDLRVLRRSDGSEITTLPSVNSFSVEGPSVLAVQISPDVDGKAIKGALATWEIGGQWQRIRPEHTPEEGCEFASGQAVSAGDTLYVLWGQRCAGNPSRWVLRSQNRTSGEIKTIAGGQTGGAYFPNTGTNKLILSGNQALIAYPNGLNSDIANLVTVDLASGAVTEVIRGVSTEIHPPSLPTRFTRSANGRFLTLVTRDGNGDEQLFLYDLNTPDKKPTAYTSVARGARVSAVRWVGDQLFYLTNTGLFSFQVGQPGTEPTLVLRGTFQGLAVDRAGVYVATSEQIKEGADVLNNLILITVSGGKKQIVVEGAKGGSALIPLAVR